MWACLRVGLAYAVAQGCDFNVVVTAGTCGLWLPSFLAARNSALHVKVRSPGCFWTGPNSEHVCPINSERRSKQARIHNRIVSKCTASNQGAPAPIPSLCTRPTTHSGQADARSSRRLRRHTTAAALGSSKTRQLLQLPAPAD
jgi:hypothetical protein